MFLLVVCKSSELALTPAFAMSYKLNENDFNRHLGEWKGNWIIISIYLMLFVHGLANGLTASEILIGPHAYSSYMGVSLAGFELRAWPLVYWGEAESQVWVSLSILFFVISALLFLANFMFIAIYFIACWRRKYYFLLPYCLLMPFYWLLISFGAWKGFIQLFTNPFYWEKTIHGLDSASNSTTVVATEADVRLVDTASNSTTVVATEADVRLVDTASNLATETVIPKKIMNR